jgi:hypothetical protein
MFENPNELKKPKPLRSLLLQGLGRFEQVMGSNLVIAYPVMSETGW